MTKPAIRIAVVAVLLAWIGEQAFASRPVTRTLTGCVVGGVFYSIYLGERAQAHRMRLPSSIVLFPLEGRTVRVTGNLLRGNSFTPTSAIEPLQPTCEARFMTAIRHDAVVQHRIKAQQAATKGAYEEAYGLLGLALMLDPAACDTYIDRAHIHALRGDESAAQADIGVLDKGQCADPRKANYLLVEDVGKAFERQGWREGALAIFRLMMPLCENSLVADLCRKAAEDNIQRISQQSPK